MNLAFVLEDEALVREHICMELKKLFPNCEVSAFKTVDELEAGVAKTKKLDLAICDINLGTTKNGIDGAKIIRKNLATKLIFLTAYSDPQTLSSLTLVDPDGFITKPFVQNQFQATVRTVLNRKSVNPENMVSGDILSLEETFKALSGLAQEIKSADNYGKAAGAIEAFVGSEQLFNKFKDNPTQTVFSDLLNRLWISSLKLKKAELTQASEKVEKFNNLVTLALVQLKSAGSKLQ